MSDSEDTDGVGAPADDEIDIEIRPVPQIAARAIVLAAALGRLALESYSGPGDPVAEAFDLREWLREERLYAAASPREQALFDRAVGSLSADEVAAWSWQGSALAVVAWALHLGEIGSAGSPPDLDRALASVPAPWDATTAWIQDSSLRPEATILRERERAEVWHWRATSEALRREASTDDRHAIDAAIMDVVAESATTGLIDEISGGDFAVGDQSVRDLAPDVLDELQMSTAQRLRALNWLCGFGNSWDDVPLDI